MQRGHGGLEPIPAAFRREAGYILDKSNCRAQIWGRTTIHTHILFLSTTNACLWIVGGNLNPKPEENPHRHFWNMQTIHRKFFPYFSDHLKGIALSLSCEHNCPNSFDFWGSVTCFLNRTEINVDSTSVDWIHGIQPIEYVPLRQTEFSGTFLKPGLTKFWKQEL